MYRIPIVLFFVLANLACASLPSQDSEQEAVFKTGAQVLVENDFALLAGKRVGLIANQTARVDTIHLVDVLHEADNLTLTAIFGPEHGLRGQAAAGEEVQNGVDEKTGVPVYSLYGDHRKPTAEMLEDVEVLVFDIQDIGARFYTYISTMGLSMQAAAENDIPFVVLDRPNPLGGNYVSGFILDTTQTSFVGMYPIPIAHGMTVGELARMIKGEGWLPGVEDVELHVVQMTGWERSDGWPSTALDWMPTSPNIPDLETARIYPGAAFFEGTSISEGRGTLHPFKYIGAPWADGKGLAAELNSRSLPGVTFEAVQFTPRPIPGMAPNPDLEGQQLSGIHQSVTDPAAFQPVETGVHVLHAFYHHAPAARQDNFFHVEWLANLAGTTRLKEMIVNGQSPEAIIESWEQEVEAFKEMRQKYLLY